MDDATGEELLIEARRRYDEELATHRQLTAEVRVWMTVAGAAVAAAAAMGPAVAQWPTNPWASMRLIASVIAVGLFVGAAIHVRRFFFGRDFQRLGSPAAWLEYAEQIWERPLSGEEGGNLATLGVQSKATESMAPLLLFKVALARQYMSAATFNAVRNSEYLADQLASKRYVALTVVAVFMGGVFHFLAGTATVACHG